METFDIVLIGASPGGYLSMEHGSNKAVIKYPGYDEVVLEFKN